MAVGWNEFVCFLVGGLLGVCLYQMWVMVVSSLVGAVLSSYAFLSLLDAVGWVEAVSWAGRNAPLLDWGMGAFILLGVVAQFVLERRRRNRKLAAKAKRRKEEP